MTQRILVTGDLPRQVNIFSEQTPLHKADAPLLPLKVEYVEQTLASLITTFCADLRPRISSAPGRSPANQAFVLWTPFHRDSRDRKNKKEDEDRVWRISIQLGVAPLTDKAPNSPAQAGADDPKPDLLVIDDLGLGFRDNPGSWPRALQKGGAPRRIILKCGAPLGQSALWKHLFLRHADKLTVIAPVGLLRARGAPISAPLSWDLTVEELAREFESGKSAMDLALARRAIIGLDTDGAACFSRLDSLRGETSALWPRARFERCLYDPQSLEGAWAASRPGAMIGRASYLVAAMARHELSPKNYPLFIAVGRGLAAARAAHLTGGGLVGAKAAEPAPQQSASEPAGAYCTAFPHELLDDIKLSSRPATKSDLLGDLIGGDHASAVALGIDIVQKGRKQLAPAPQTEIGAFFTVDRDEIERAHSVRNLILAYQAHKEDKHPLALAVFGPPGSGKTFIVEQLAKDVGGPNTECLKFNVSQFTGPDDLHYALHHVRDTYVRGQMPFVFWDEFDTNGLEWLKDFLVPMRDGVFQWKGSEFPIGRAVFVFAGGTRSSFAEFDQAKAEDFRRKKGPDFVSRLRGYIDVKGPNPSSDAADLSYVIRRAILLRQALEKQFPKIRNKDANTLAVSTNLVRAFLEAKEFLHGGRSLESIVSMGRLNSGPCFQPSDLPARKLILMHVTEDFLEKLDRTVSLSEREVEDIAAACHEAWDAAREKQERKTRPRSNKNTTHPWRSKPYGELDEEGKERNRSTARHTLARLFGSGYILRRQIPGVPATVTLPEWKIEATMRAEHDRWLRELLLRGWAGGEKTNRPLRLNKDIRRYDDLNAAERPFDRIPLTATLATLSRLGYSLGTLHADA